MESLVTIKKVSNLILSHVIKFLMYCIKVLIISESCFPSKPMSLQKAFLKFHEAKQVVMSHYFVDNRLFCNL